MLTLAVIFLVNPATLDEIIDMHMMYETVHVRSE